MRMAHADGTIPSHSDAEDPGTVNDELKGMNMVARFARIPRNRWTLLSTIIGPVLAVYHQWLGGKFANLYFVGDATEYLASVSVIAANAPPGFVHGAVASRSPLDLNPKLVHPKR